MYELTNELKSSNTVLQSRDNRSEKGLTWRRRKSEWDWTRQQGGVV
ncbi:hypothetical protein BIFDEN_01230 [Bifidobacterium dentium ATCC 27678]|nr:hypothetical protein BIFDEN_01230 [Bifidobacterium dentium ATCC 27678]